jgi:hypothetical protein
MATAVVASDLTASLSFYLASELTNAFADQLTLSEITMLALAACVLLGTAGSHIPRLRGHVPALIVRSLSETVTMASFLSATVVVQLSIRLVRASIGLPWARILTVVSVLLLLRITLSAVDLSRHSVVYQRVAQD